MSFSVEYLSILILLDAEARVEVAKLGGNPTLEDVLNELLEWKL
jgi:hypothetical protein